MKIQDICAPHMFTGNYASFYDRMAIPFIHGGANCLNDHEGEMNTWSLCPAGIM